MRETTNLADACSTTITVQVKQDETPVEANADAAEAGVTDDGAVAGKKVEVDDIFPVWFFHPWARIFTACWVILADMVMVSSRSCGAISSTQAD